MPKDYYKILGINRDVSQDEIKKAYRRLAHQYHPDKQGGDEAKFKEINEAYQVLGDEKKRVQYNQFGSAFEHAGQGGFQGGFGDFGDFSEIFKNQQGGGFKVDFDVGDIFSDFFGFGAKSAKTKVSRGRDISVDLEINLEDAFLGLKKEISLNKMTTCGVCRGKGAEEGVSFKKCSDCGGTGQTRKNSQTILGTFSQVFVCSKCEGEGSIPETLCKKCRGEGRVREISNIKINIPSGIRDGQIIKIPQTGEAARKNGIDGDLYIVVHIKPHYCFKRKGDDIYCKEHINFSQAILGDKIEARTLSGPVMLKVPSGIQSGKMLRLKGRGMLSFGSSGRGDQYVEIIIKTPTKLSRRAKDLMEELKNEGM